MGRIKFFGIICMSFFVLSCSNDFDKKYLRVNSTPFETTQKMNQYAVLKVKNDDVMLSICSDWGCSEYEGKNIGDVYTIEGFDLRIQSNELILTPQDSETSFIFKEETK